MQIAAQRVYQPASTSAQVTAVRANATTQARIPAVSASGTGPNGPPGSWTLVFEDTFSGSSLSSTYWATSWFNGGSINNVTTSAANVAVTGGNLVLTRSASGVGALVNTNPNDAASTGVTYTTGVVEARVLFPGNGTSLYNWPAWWTDGQNWPTTGEHDIAEVLGGDVTVNYHSSSGSHGQGSIPGYQGDAFHTYTLHRKANNTADMYYDGVLTKSYATDDGNSPHYLIFNVGGGQGSPDQLGAAGQLKVDYVRVWQ